MIKPLKIPWSKAPKGTIRHIFESRGFGFWEVEQKLPHAVTKTKLIQSGLILPPGHDYRTSSRTIPLKYTV